MPASSIFSVPCAEEILKLPLALGNIFVRTSEMCFPVVTHRSMYIYKYGLEYIQDTLHYLSQKIILPVRES